MKSPTTAMLDGAPRQCGPCQSCCTIYAVPELDKLERERCTHLTPLGCGIYDQRPAGCEAFRCLWHVGELALGDRPDRLGVMFVAHVSGGVGMAIAHEVENGALERARGVIEELSRRVVVAFDDGHSWRLYGAAGKVTRVRDHLATGAGDAGSGRT